MGLACAGLLLVVAAHAQLAITEVMSSAATNLGSTLVVPKSDFWELTNFGTNTISLDGYAFSDRDTDPGSWVSAPFAGCFIAPGESIIFLRTDATTNRQGFLNWWGANNLPANLQVRMYPKKPGFDAEVDAVQLFDRDGNLVDRVDFGRAFRGHTFTYDPGTGEFGGFSVRDVNGAFAAVQTDDVGSPGFTTGPVPLAMVQHPASVTQDAGLDVEFFAVAAGLPRPAYQWFFNGAPIPGACGAMLVLSNIQPQAAGNYSVRASNGLATVFSEPAALVVNTSPSAAAIVKPPVDTTIFENQTAVFSVKARGYPPPLFQWQRDGANISGATNPILSVANATLSQNGTLYSVRVENMHGTTNAGARLFVTRPPRLAYTNVQQRFEGPAK